MINGTIELDFGIVVYNHEWIIFCSSSVQLKGQGDRSQVKGHTQSPENNDLACISESNKLV